MKLRLNKDVFGVLANIYVCGFLVLQLFASLPHLYSVTWFVQRVLLFAGVLIIVLQVLFLFRKECSFSIGNTPLLLLLFTLWYLLVIVLNRDKMLVDNLKIFGYMIIQVLIIFGAGFSDQQNQRLNSKKESINKILVFSLTLVSIISLITFLPMKELSFVAHNTLYAIGWHEGRLSGIVGNPNILGMYAASAMLLLLCLRMKPLHSMLIFLPNFLVLLLTKSRSTIVVFLIVLTIILYSRHKKAVFECYARLNRSSNCAFVPVLFRILAVLSVTVLMFVIIQKGSAIREFLQGRASSDSSRYELFGYGLRAFEQSPFFGSTSTGIGVVVGRLLKEGSAFTPDNPIISNPHNTYVQVLAASGLIGLLLFMSHIARLIVRSFHDKSMALFRSVVRGSLAIVVFNLIIGLFECYFMFSASFLACLYWYSSGRVWYSGGGTEP